MWLWLELFARIVHVDSYHGYYICHRTLFGDTVALHVPRKTIRLSRDIPMLLAAIRKRFPSRNRRLCKSFSMVIMLSLTSVSSQLAFYMTDSKMEMWKEVHLSSSTRESGQMFEVLQYLSQELSDVGLNSSPHIVSTCIYCPFQHLFCKGQKPEVRYFDSKW